jgi:hypothetical protein
MSNISRFVTLGDSNSSAPFTYGPLLMLLIDKFPLTFFLNLLPYFPKKKKVSMVGNPNHYSPIVFIHVALLDLIPSFNLTHLHEPTQTLKSQITYINNVSLISIWILFKFMFSQHPIPAFFTALSLMLGNDSAKKPVHFWNGASKIDFFSIKLS